MPERRSHFLGTSRANSTCIASSAVSVTAIDGHCQEHQWQRSLPTYCPQVSAYLLTPGGSSSFLQSLLVSNQVFQSPHEYAVLFFLAFACALRRRSLPHTVPSGCFTMQRTYLQRLQAKFATSSTDAGKCFTLTAFIGFVQFVV